nr:MAG TPA: hypothetical protein [Caudoviricetes sp.]
MQDAPNHSFVLPTFIFPSVRSILISSIYYMSEDRMSCLQEVY